jgi:hypothetical protein
MTEQMATLPAKDVASVGTRISWGAIFAGSALSLALYFLLALLGAAAGLSVSEHVAAADLHIAAIAWSILIISLALFVGGLVTSQFTVGEDRIEAVLYGMIMWAVLLVALLVLGAVGVRSSFSVMMIRAHAGTPMTTSSWEKAAGDAGVPAEVIEDWRSKQRPSRSKSGADTQDPQNHAALVAAATRLTWYAFAGAWVSMLAAAAGAYFGAGPTFRVVAVDSRKVAFLHT